MAEEAEVNEEVSLTATLREEMVSVVEEVAATTVHRLLPHRHLSSYLNSPLRNSLRNANLRRIDSIVTSLASLAT